VFRALPGDLGEALRTELLKNSRLFHAMTSMHLTANDYAESRALVDQQRIGGTPWEATTGSSFAMIETSDIARKALFDPATDAARQHNALPNAALAGWVAAHETAAHDYLGQIACGVSNLFALACARRAVAVSEPPTDDEAALWLRSWTLDRPPSQALLAYTGGKERSTSRSTSCRRSRPRAPTGRSPSSRSPRPRSRAPTPTPAASSRASSSAR
jgi:hypothetical protein